MNGGLDDLLGMGANPAAQPASSSNNAFYDRKPIGTANPLAPTPGQKPVDDDLDLEALLK